MHLIDYLSNIFALPFSSEDKFNADQGPFLAGSFNSVKVKCLIATGASVSCMSKQSFDTIPKHVLLESIPIPRGCQLSVATGHSFLL